MVKTTFCGNVNKSSSLLLHPFYEFNYYLIILFCSLKHLLII